MKGELCRSKDKQDRTHHTTAHASTPQHTPAQRTKNLTVASSTPAYLSMALTDAYAAACTADSFLMRSSLPTTSLHARVTQQQ